LQKTERSYYPALDGLRGLAILLVVVYHNFGFINYFFLGWLGVDLFFVLSGFLITDILLKTQNDPNYLRNFYGRRLLRIFPLYYLVLIIFLLILPAFRPPINLNYYTQNQLWFWTYLQNWLFVFKPIPLDSLALSHFWSLAVEEQFYLIWPFVILFIKKPKPLFFLMFSLLLAVVAGRFLIWTFHIEKLAYFNLYTFSRIDGICIGSMLALLRQFNISFLSKHTSKLVFTLAALNFLFFFFNRATNFSFPFLAIVGYTTFAIIFGLLVNEALSRENKVVQFIFNNSILKFFGTVSYGLYIFHWPIYLLIKSQNWWSNALFTSLFATLIAIAVSILSFYFFETPLLRLKKHFKYTHLN
jgi:peptidoglycan/LPS O-acetylase OafA/YrhL